MNRTAPMCDLLASIFAAPVPAERIVAWRSAEGAAALQDAGEASGIGAEMAAMLAALGEDAAALETAHHVLFSGLAGPRTVAPFQSVHADARGLLWGQPAAAMRALLGRHDVHPQGVLANEPPDHIAVQFALLAELLRRSDRAAAAELIDAHLLPWLPDFAAACADADPQGFHAAAARAAARLAAEIRRALRGPPNTDMLEEAS